MLETPNIVQETSGWRLVALRLSSYWGRVKHRLPRLVWIGQELDVVVTFSQDRLDPDDPWRAFFSGGIHDIQKQLGNMGITFDSGQGPDGRDWEWDFSLKGPISVCFRGHASRPDRRRAKPVPTLVVNNDAA